MKQAEGIEVSVPDDVDVRQLSRMSIPKELLERVERIQRARGVQARNDMVRMLISVGCDLEEARLAQAAQFAAQQLAPAA